MTRVRFLPFRNDLSALHIIDHVYGPLLSGHPTDYFVHWLFFLRDPELYDMVFNNLSFVERTVVKVARGERLSPKEMILLRKARKFWIGDNIRRFVEEQYEAFKEEWKKYEKDVFGILDSTFPIKPEIHVFPSFEAAGGCGGTVYLEGYIGMSFGEKSTPKDCVWTFIHELIHVYHRMDKVLDNKLKDLKKKHGVPLAEAFTETVTNVVAWKIGLQDEPFAGYYHKGWKKLVEWEEVFREVLKENNYDLFSLREYVLGVE